MMDAVLRSAAMPQNVPQRKYWDGHPVDLGDAWVLRKGDKRAARSSRTSSVLNCAYSRPTCSARRCAGRQTKC